MSEPESTLIATTWNEQPGYSGRLWERFWRRDAQGFYFEMNDSSGFSGPVKVRYSSESSFRRALAAEMKAFYGRWEP